MEKNLIFKTHGNESGNFNFFNRHSPSNECGIEKDLMSLVRRETRDEVHKDIHYTSCVSRAEKIEFAEAFLAAYAVESVDVRHCEEEIEEGQAHQNFPRESVGVGT